MKEIVLISAGTGAGKTSLAAGFAGLSQQMVIADCDVNASDLSLIMVPETLTSELFIERKSAVIDQELCRGCGAGMDICRFHAIQSQGASGESSRTVQQVDTVQCQGCGSCTWTCPENAIAMEDVIQAQIFQSATRFGPMVHAALKPGSISSEQLVTRIRQKARQIARDRSIDTILVDGCPGIGSGAMASISEAHGVIIVTDSTITGIPELVRMTELTRKMGIRAMTVINKWDINPELSRKIEEESAYLNIEYLGRIPFDTEVTRAQAARQSIVEFTENGVNVEIDHLWNRIHSLLPQ